MPLNVGNRLSNNTLVGIYKINLQAGKKWQYIRNQWPLKITGKWKYSDFKIRIYINVNMSQLTEIEFLERICSWEYAAVVDVWLMNQSTKKYVVAKSRNA